MIKSAIIGLGKMGISHLAILNAHPLVDLQGVCDTNSFITGCMGKLTTMNFYSDFNKMLEKCELDAIMIATPSASHAPLIRESLNNGLHVFVEKPYCLSTEEGLELTELAESKGVVNQVGYHNKFVGAFTKVKELLDNKVIGEVYSIKGEAYGPVVLKPKGGTWRLKKSEGGGCLHDYASHVVDLMNYYVGVPEKVGGTVLKKIFSRDVGDAVYSTLYYPNDLTGQLSINWSEPSYRKMSTMVTLHGKKGKIIVDRQECKIFLNEQNEELNLPAGWTIFYTTEMTPPVWFYLRGEEYSSQVDYFINCISGHAKPGKNSFRSAYDTDRVVEMLSQDAQ